MTIDCADAIGSEEVPPDYEIVANAVALPTAPHHGPLQTTQTGDATPAVRLWAKTGLGVRAGVASELDVPLAVAGVVAIGWAGMPSGPAHHVVVPACPTELTTSGWLWFVGGYWVADPICAPITVRSPGASQTVEVGLGTSCAGQQGVDGASDS